MVCVHGGTLQGERHLELAIQPCKFLDLASFGPAVLSLHISAHANLHRTADVHEVTGMRRENVAHECSMLPKWCDECGDNHDSLLEEEA
jgi:hypothetical protein